MTSADPLRVFPDSAIDLHRIIKDAGFYFPYLIQEDVDQIVTYLQNGKVVDPLNLVLWGAKTPDEILQFVHQLSRWRSTKLGSPFWGLADFEGSRQKVETVEMLQQAQFNWAQGFIVVTRIVSSFARHHVRILKPIFAGEEWGYLALVGAHTEALGRIRGIPYIWHRISDWHVARELFAESARSALTDNAFEVRRFPTEGTWQGRKFDGRVIFVRLSGTEQA